MLTTQAGLGMVVVPLEVIGRGFGVEDQPAQLSWFAAAYSLSVGTIILPAGRIGDLWGHKKVVVLGYAWTSIWCLAAGLSSYLHSSPVLFDVCRGFQGMGYSFLLPNAVAILARCTHAGHWKRALYFTCFAASAPNGFLLGGCFSGLVAQFHPDDWEWGFYLAAIGLAALALLSWFVLPSDRYLTMFHGTGEPSAEEKSETTTSTPAGDMAEKTPNKASRREDGQGFDWWGTVTAISGLVLFNFAWNQAGVVGWDTPYVPVLLVVGLALIVLFLWVETRVRFPLVPQEIWTTQNSIVLACVALGWSSFGIWNFYSVRWLINIRQSTLMSTVAMVTPCGISGIVAASTSMVLLTRFGPAWVMLVAMTAFCLANLLLATMPAQQLYWKQAFPSYVIAPLGMDMSFPSASLIVANSLPQHKQGVAGSLVNTIINYCVAIGLGLAGTVEAHTNAGGSRIVDGYRYSLYTGVGLAGLGTALAAANAVAEVARGVRRRRGQVDREASVREKADAAPTRQ
ncbi:unnamed protein product [Parajaminaea phylloscopi]